MYTVYSTFYAPTVGEEKKWLKHVLLPWIVHYCGCRLSSRDASRSRCCGPCRHGSGTWILLCRELVKLVKCQACRLRGPWAQRPRGPDKRASRVIRTSKSIPCYVIGFSSAFARPRPRCPCTIADINILEGFSPNPNDGLQEDGWYVQTWILIHRQC